MTLGFFSLAHCCWLRVSAAVRAGKVNTRQKSALQKAEKARACCAHQRFYSRTDFRHLQMDQSDYSIITGIRVYHFAGLSNAFSLAQFSAIEVYP